MYIYAIHHYHSIEPAPYVVMSEVKPYDFMHYLRDFLLYGTELYGVSYDMENEQFGEALMASGLAQRFPRTEFLEEVMKDILKGDSAIPFEVNESTHVYTIKTDSEIPVILMDVFFIWEGLNEYNDVLTDDQKRIFRELSEKWARQ